MVEERRAARRIGSIEDVANANDDSRSLFLRINFKLCFFAARLPDLLRLLVLDHRGLILILILIQQQRHVEQLRVAPLPLPARDRHVSQRRELGS